MQQCLSECCGTALRFRVQFCCCASTPIERSNHVFLLQASVCKALPAFISDSLAGKTVLVTGGNCGLGFEAAIKLVTLGATTVILACQNPKKEEAAVAEMERRMGRVGVLRSWELDMNN